MSLYGYHNEVAEKRRRFLRWWRENKPDHQGKTLGELTLEELNEELAALVGWHPDELAEFGADEYEVMYILMQDDVTDLSPLEINERYDIAEGISDRLLDFIQTWDAKRSRRN